MSKKPAVTPITLVASKPFVLDALNVALAPSVARFSVSLPPLPSMPPLPAKVTPAFTVIASAPAPPSMSSMLANVLSLSANVPAAAPVTTITLPSPSPVSVSSSAPPSSVPVMLPAFWKLNVSAPAPPARFSMLDQPLVFPANVPLPLPVTTKAFALPSPVSVSVPAPPETPPTRLPEVPKTKPSFAVPPTRLAKLANDGVVLRSPSPSFVMFQVVFEFGPTSVSFALSPT